MNINEVGKLIFDYCKIRHLAFLDKNCFQFEEELLQWFYFCLSGCEETCENSYSMCGLFKGSISENFRNSIPKRTGEGSLFNTEITANVS